MDELNIFIPIRKINQERHEIYGWAAREEVDNSDEIMDYATSKPLFQNWSNNAQKRSGGKSLGNVRSMHSNIAAGKLIELKLDDKVRGFYVGAKIVDDAEWKKVDQGVYTGFSIGGSYVKRWSDYNNPGKIRYTAKPNEISIVDSPCISSATFEVVKADGLTVQKEFQPGKGVNMLKLDGTTEMTADEQRAFLQSKLADSFPYVQRTDGVVDNIPPNSGSRYWMRDFSKDCVYVGMGEKTYSIPYTVDETNNVSFGVVTEVIAHVTYEPVPASTEAVGKFDESESRDKSGKWTGNGGEDKSSDDKKANDSSSPKGMIHRKDADGHYYVEDDDINAELPDKKYPQYEGHSKNSSGKESHAIVSRGSKIKGWAYQDPDGVWHSRTETQPKGERANYEDPKVEIKDHKSKDEAMNYIEQRTGHKFISRDVNKITASSLQKSDIPSSPEPIADIPLPSLVGPDYVVEHAAPPNALLEVKPDAVPSQEVLAAHAVATKDIDAAMEAWLPKIGLMVKSAVAEEFKAAADLNKSTPTAPAPRIPVYHKKLINVVRKEK